jgi:predicted nucleotide-binding protein
MNSQQNKYYHVIIELNTKDYTKLSDLDKIDKNELIEDIIKPYLDNSVFFFDGREISKKDVKSIKIYQTDRKSKILVDIENSKEYTGVYWLKEDVVACKDKYSEDVTSKIIKYVISNNKANKIEQNFDLSKVFIVHGHDDVLKLEVSRFLEKLDITPIILHEQANEGRTIVEKIEANTNVGFAIVLYTPCDTGGTNKDNLQNRARQNVVFEHGYLIGKLKRDKVVALVKGEVETPGDIAGVVYVSYGKSWQVDIAKELKSAGYHIDLNKLL